MNEALQQALQAVKVGLPLTPSQQKLLADEVLRLQKALEGRK